MFILDKNNLNSFLLGSLFLSTGGGLPPKEHKKIFERLFKIKKRFLVKEIKEFNQNDWLASIYGVGSPAQAGGSFKQLIGKATELFQRHFKLKIKGLIPGEIGAEGMVFEAALYLNLPVVDSDLVGGRAAPEIQMDVFSVYQQPLTPLIGMAVNGKQLFFEGRFSAQEIENILRRFFAQNKGVGVVIGYPIKAGKYQKIGAKNTLTKALKIGQILGFSSQPFKDLLFFLKGKIVAKEKLKEVSLKDQNGFLMGKLFFETKTIEVKNENMVCLEKDKIVAKVPDLIVILESDSLKPIHNTEIKNYLNQELIIFSCNGEKYWYSKRGKQLFSYAF